MNIEDLNKILKEKYNCRATDIFEFCNKDFDLSKENIVEVTNKKLLDVFRKKNETHSDVEY